MVNLDSYELYRDDILFFRMNDMIKSKNRKPCVYGRDLQREGKIEIPKDLIVFEFDTGFTL